MHARARVGQGIDHGVCPLGGHLQHQAQFLGEQPTRGIAVGQLDVQPAPPGKGHLGQGGQQTAIRTIMQGQNRAIGLECGQHRKGGTELFGIVEVRRRLAHALVHLRQHRTAQTVAATAEIEQQQFAVARVPPQLWREGAPGIAHRRKARHDQRQRSPLAAVLARLLPAGAHGQGILAHRDAQAECRAQLAAHGADRVVQGGVLAGLATGGHPVGRQADVLDAFDVRSQQIG